MKPSASLVPASRYGVVGAIRLNMSMRTALLDQLDRAARAAGYTRSGFVAQAVREKLARQGTAA